MTYKELLQQLKQLNEEQLSQDVAIWDCYGQDEYYQASVEFVFATETDVLDKDHPIIRFWWPTEPNLNGYLKSNAHWSECFA